MTYRTHLRIKDITRMAAPQMDTVVKTNVYNYTYDTLNRLELATTCQIKR
ncbi:MAG: hypothetical protein MUO76_13920 [Anaerolineaceae bacterium]|nr:hypothetical protein [Anaerolineaceae bacterium]